MLHRAIFPHSSLAIPAFFTCHSRILHLSFPRRRESRKDRVLNDKFMKLNHNWILSFEGMTRKPIKSSMTFTIPSSPAPFFYHPWAFSMNPNMNKMTEN
jgi:hypothetical protein